MEIEKKRKQFDKWLGVWPPDHHGVQESHLLNRFISEIGREPTETEFKKYVEIVVMPTEDRKKRLNQIKLLMDMIKRNNLKIKREEVEDGIQADQ